MATNKQIAAARRLTADYTDGGRTGNPPKKEITVRFKPAELKAIAAQRGATHFVEALEYAETSGPGASPGWRMAGFLTRCKYYWMGLPAFQDAQVDIEPLSFDKNKLAKSLSVTARVNPDDAAAMSAFTERYVPIIVNGWIDCADGLERGRAELKAISRTSNPSDESARVHSAIVNLRGFSKGSLSGEDAAHTGRHWTVNQPIYADGGTSATHLSRDAAREFDAAQARGELASSRGDQGWYVVFSQNLPIAWHTTADGWTVADKSTVVGANPSTARNIAIVKGALGLR